MTANWSRPRASIGVSLTNSVALFDVPAVSPATVTSEYATSGSRPMAVVTRRASNCVASRLVPSGARRVMSKPD